tara:strand:- start:7825 stop:8241 length:417 start_codon:yes stop_codon:yes gene_type:complete
MFVSAAVMGWASALGLMVAVLACGGASLAALRLFDALKCERAPRPFCTVAATTRWVLWIRPAGRVIEPIDMMRMGALLLVFASAGMTMLSVYDLIVMPWGFTKPTVMAGFIFTRISMGSGLMILLAGASQLAAQRGSQ